MKITTTKNTIISKLRTNWFSTRIIIIVKIKLWKLLAWESSFLASFETVLGFFLSSRKKRSNFAHSVGWQNGNTRGQPGTTRFFARYCRMRRTRNNLRVAIWSKMTRRDDCRSITIYGRALGRRWFTHPLYTLRFIRSQRVARWDMETVLRRVFESQQTANCLKIDLPLGPLPYEDGSIRICDLNSRTLVANIQLRRKQDTRREKRGFLRGRFSFLIFLN